MKPYKIRIQDEALEELQEIQAYMEQVSETAPYVVCDRILSRIESLAATPGLGRVCDFDSDFLQIPVGNYLILYMRDDPKQAIEIHHVLHSARNIQKILADRNHNTFLSGQKKPKTQ